MRTNRKDDIFVQRRLYIDKTHRALDIFRQRFRDSALPYTAVAVIFSYPPVSFLLCDIIYEQPPPTCLENPVEYHLTSFT